MNSFNMDINVVRERVNKIVKLEEIKHKVYVDYGKTSSNMSVEYKKEGIFITVNENPIMTNASKEDFDIATELIAGHEVCHILHWDRKITALYQKMIWQTITLSMGKEEKFIIRAISGLTEARADFYGKSICEYFGEAVTKEVITAFGDITRGGCDVIEDVHQPFMLGYPTCHLRVDLLNKYGSYNENVVSDIITAFTEVYNRTIKSKEYKDLNKTKLDNYLVEFPVNKIKSKIIS